MENNRDIQFWMTFGSLVSLILCIGFILFCGIKEEFVFRKQYCLFLIPVLFYFMFQFIVNYIKIVEDNDRH